MHGYEYRNKYLEHPVDFSFNGDFSGDVAITLDSSIAQAELQNFTRNGEDMHRTRVKIPFEALESLVLHAWRRRTIARLEDMTDDELRVMLFE